MRHSGQSKNHKENVAPVYNRWTAPARLILVLAGLSLLVLISFNMYSFPASLLLWAAASIGSVVSSEVLEPSKACAALGASLDISNAVVQISSFVPAGTKITLSGGKYHSFLLSKCIPV